MGFVIVWMVKLHQFHVYGIEHLLMFFLKIVCMFCVFVMCSASVSVYIMWVKKEGSGTDGGTNSPHGSFSDAGSLAA